MVVKESQRTANFTKNNEFQLLNGIKKCSLKQIVSLTCTLKEKFFAVATFEGLLVISFERD